MPTSNRRALQLVLIEDNPGDRLLVRSLLEEDPDQRWEIAEAATLAEGLRALDEASCDAVLLDLNLPDGSGVEVVRQVIGRVPNMPIVVLTGSIETSLGDVCVQAGAEDYVPKAGLGAHALRRALGYAISRRQRLQLAELKKRLDATARLAASVAHEINNPAAIIDGSMELIARRCELLRSELLRNADTPPLLRDLADGLLREIDEVVGTNRTCIERIATVVKSLGAFSRPDVDAVSEVRVDELVRHAMRLSRADLRFLARVEDDLETAPAIVGNRDKLVRLVMNLLVNSAQAFDKPSPEQNVVRLKLSVDGSHLRLVVSDNGAGMNADVLGRAFEPFFTTRDNRETPGLGLTICADIAHYHGGTITAESRVGEGTSVTVSLPIESELTLPKAATPARTPKAATPESPIQRILLIDDEPLLRAVTTQLLSSDFEVVTAEDGVDALSILRDDDAFDAIVCDLVMPNMDGPSFYEELANVSPELRLRTVFMTGGAYTERTRRFLATQPVAVVSKPFRRKELLEAITQQVVAAQLVDGQPANADQE